MCRFSSVVRANEGVIFRYIMPCRPVESWSVKYIIPAITVIAVRAFGKGFAVMLLERPPTCRSRISRVCLLFGHIAEADRYISDESDRSRECKLFNRRGTLPGSGLSRWFTTIFHRVIRVFTYDTIETGYPVLYPCFFLVLSTPLCPCALLPLAILHEYAEAG